MKCSPSGPLLGFVIVTVSVEGGDASALADYRLVSNMTYVVSIHAHSRKA